jgi:hypothetical protein
MQRLSVRHTTAFIAALGLLAGCNGDSTGAKAVAEVQIELPAQVVAGDVIDAEAVAFDARGNVISSPPAAAWTSTNVSVATITPAGRLTALAPGNTTIRAQIGNSSASMAVTVREDLFAGCGMRQLAVGATHAGILGQGLCRLDDGTYIDLFEITVPTQRTLTLTMRSTSFDAYLILWNRFGEYLTEDDDGAGGTDARIVRQFAPGRYVIGANSYFEGEGGSYTLSVQ